MIEQHYDNGQKVYYKRDGKSQWLEPAKVLAQCGKVIFIRHGGIPPNRITGIPCEKKDNETDAEYQSEKISESQIQM